MISNEVFEQIPDLEQGLRGTCQLFKPSRVLIGTCPSAYTNVDPIIKARVENGAIKYLAEAEYHGHPVDPEGCSLVFQIPSWSLIEQCKAAGFLSHRPFEELPEPRWQAFTSFAVEGAYSESYESPNCLPPASKWRMQWLEPSGIPGRK